MIKVKTYFLYGIICLSALTGVQNAQGQGKEAYNWYFGDYVGMTWNSTQTIGGLSGLPTPLPASAMTESPLSHHEGVFGMSDVDGNLLFYSDGVTVWNKNHQMMTNGNVLTGSNSSAQSGIVIPYPGQSRKYIAITVGLNMGNTLACSIIDMEGSGGLGEVMAFYDGIAKNTPLTGALGVLGESVAAFRHTNGKDYWIVAPGKGVGAASALNVWKVTSSGIQTDCFASYPLPADTDPAAGANGYLRFSFDGKYFAWPEKITNQLFFGEFNPSTGTFPTIRVMDLGYDGYGVEFSPSKKILYVTRYSTKEIHVYPFEDLLVSANPKSVPHRSTTVTKATNNLHALQSGPDGRIYAPVYMTTTMLVIDNVDDYNGFTTHLVNGLLPTGTYYQALAGLPNYMSHFFAPVENTCSYFTDDLWYFGGNGGGGGGGIAFNDAGDGTKIAAAASGESLVNSNENSFSVSSPGCGSSLIFYSQHDQLYNAKHQPMADGKFSGDESVADGLAACYIGDNKYMLFSVTAAYERGTAMGLQYHIIDMNADNGYGRRINSITLETSGMAESVELAPVPGTSNEYWLIYNMISSNEIRVRKITGNIVGGVLHTLSMSGHSVSGKSYIFRANSTYNRFVLTYSGDNKMALFDFNVTTGDISLNEVKSAPFMSSDIYGAEFSPNGKYIYCTTYYGDCEISQYDIATGTFTKPFSYGDKVYDVSGGGLKPGPDGRLYVKREGQYMGVIANPNAPLTQSGYTRNGFDLGYGVFSTGMTFSTGLTPPAVCPSGLNEAPVTSNDSITVFLNKPAVCLNVMRNDTDPNPGDSLNIVNVFFLDAEDANKVDVSFQPNDSTICIAAKAAAQTDDVIRLVYTVRDDANPIRLCANATVTVRFDDSPSNINDANCPAPDVKFVETPAFAYHGDGDSLVISTELTNIGKASLMVPFYISAYKNTVTVANKMVTDSSMVSLNIEDTIPVAVTIRNFSSYTSLTEIILRINDKGDAAYVQQECDYDNNTVEYDLDGLPKAANDTVATLINTDVTVNVKSNDAIPSAGCPSPVLAIAVDPTKGKASVVGEQIKYIPKADFYGIDSLVYRLTCTTGKTEAKVYIVVNKPKKDAYTGCSGTEVKVEFEAINNVQYKWYTSETASTQNGVTENIHNCAAPSEWWVEAQYKGKPVAPRLKVTVKAYPALTAGSIKDNDTVCYNTAPKPFVMLPASGGYGAIVYQWQYSYDNGAHWTGIGNATSDNNYAPNDALTQTTWYRRRATNTCGTVHTDSVKVTVYPQSLGNYPDLRIRVCPDVGTINLSKYIDSLAVKSILWKSVSPSIIDPHAGTIATNNLNEHISFYTLTYTVVNPCISNDSVERKVYLERLKHGRMRPLRDTVAVCYKLAERLQLNQIFGIEAAGKWSFAADGNIIPYITRLTSPTYKDAVILNGKAIYENIVTDYSYHGVATKRVTVTYIPENNSCLKGKSYTITIILTPDMTK